MGDPSKIVLLDEVLRVVREEDLVSQAKVTGDYLLKNLVQLCVSVFISQFTFICRFY